MEDLDELLNDDLFSDEKVVEKKVEEKPEPVKEEKKVMVDNETGEILNTSPKKEKLDSKPEPKPVEKPNAGTINNTQQPVKNEVVGRTALYALTEDFTNKIKAIVTLNNEKWTSKEQTVASNIISMSDKLVRANGYNWSDIDVIGNDVIGAIKHWAKLGIDGYDHLHPMVRRNKTTGKVDLTFEPQYQTYQKLIKKYCTKNIFNFATEAICKGDKLNYKFDYLLGEDVLTSFEKSPNRKPNSLDEIVGAFCVAYYKEDGQVKQIVEEIDKERIMKAYNKAKTHDIWNEYTEIMVKKTAVRCLYKSGKIEPFMQYPDDVLGDVSIIDEESDVDFSNKEREHKNVIDAEIDANNFGSGEILDI